ncbi:hypothetical protein D3C85_1717300 [compost metagenome]
MEALAFADQQRAADLVLQLFHHLADGGLGDKQRLGGAGEVLLAHQLGKVTQCLDVHLDYALMELI